VILFRGGDKFGRAAGRSLLAAGIVALLLSAAIAPARAAASSNVPAQASGKALADIEAQRQALFQQILKDPSNVELTLKYAELSSEAGDLEGAISALERLLIYAPQVAQINYQLGILYMRLGAYAQASTDFKAALASPDATPEIKATAAQYIDIADKQQSGDYFTGSFVPGVRYQTNANGGAQVSTIDIFGQQFQLNDAAMASPDYNAYISAVVHGSHDLQDQGDRVNLDGNFYASAYASHTELNTLAGEVEIGPVLALDRYGFKMSTLGVYAILGAVELGGTPYLYTLGAGEVITTNPAAGLSLQSRLEYRQEYYQSSAARPTNDEYTGARIRLTDSATLAANDWLKIYSAGYAERKFAEVGTKADWEAGVSAGMTLALGDSTKSRPWTVDMQAGLVARLYDEADISQSSDPRFDKVGFVQATLDVPLTEKVIAEMILGYRRQISNYPLYTFDDASISLAIKTDF
jgi:tetratricopeptide (TPR) repeat protein